MAKTTETPITEDQNLEAATDEAKEQTAAEATEPKPKAKKRKAKRMVSEGHIHVLATFNNTIITVTDPKGNTISTASAGGSGFRGSKKGTAYAAQVAAEKAIGTAKQNNGLTKADVFVKGVGMGREAAIRTLVNQRVAIENIRDVTGIPHGGVRPRKAKRN
jgi:small subunit ribosomal protein S11